MAKPRAVWTALAIVYVVWGSTYLGMRYLVDTVPPFLGAGVRYALAGVLLGGILAAVRGRNRLRVPPRQVAACGLVGLLLLVGGNGLVMLGEQTISSGLAALCVAAVPLFVVVLRLATGDRPHGATLLGVVVGFVGIAALIEPGGSGTTGIVTVLCAALSWSIGSFASGSLPLPEDPLVGTAYEMTIGGLALVVVSAARGELASFSPGDVSRASGIAFGYLVVFGSLVAFTAYVWLLQSGAPISTVSTYAYVNPGVAVLLGAATGEQLTGRILVGGLLVIVAVAVVVTTEGRARPPTAREPAPAVDPAPALGVETADPGTAPGPRPAAAPHAGGSYRDGR